MSELPTRMITVLSYNLWHGNAQPELASLVEANDPDVLCVQEAHALTLPERLGDLRLAVTTPQNRLGVGLYVKSSRFEIEDADSFGLTVSRHDRFVGGTGHRLAAARVRDREAGRSIVLGSFHGTPFTDSNGFRRLQVDDAHKVLGELGPGLPTLMAGDYNHPILLGMLRRHVRRRGFDLAQTPTSTFHKAGSLMRGRFDLATISHLDVVDARVLPQRISDHRPAFFTVKYSEPGAGHARA